MEKTQKYPNKIMKATVIIWGISIISFLIVFMNILTPIFPNRLALFFSNFLTNKNFSLVSSIFILTSILSIFLSYIQKRDIGLRKRSNLKLIKSIQISVILEIILFIGLILVYSIN
jgi:magnesium-transporting ATPase (P-type)